LSYPVGPAGGPWGRGRRSGTLYRAAGVLSTVAIGPFPVTVGVDGVSCCDTMFLVDTSVIGDNIRQIRGRAGLTLTALAEAAGLSKGALSKIENGSVSATVATLITLADVLRCPLADFFQEPDRDTPFTVTRSGEGMSVQRSGGVGYDYRALASDRRYKQAEPFVLTMQPDDPEGVFQHSGEEFVYVLSGRIAFSVGGREMDLKRGDSIYFDPTHEHRTRVLGNKPVRLLCLFIRDATRRPVPDGLPEANP